MTPGEFVEAMRLVVIDSVVEGELATLGRPPGRRPWPNAVELSDWYNGLDAASQTAVARVVRAAAFATAFSFLAVLDGVSTFDDDGGSLKLIYVGPDGSETQLNDPTTMQLHAELRGDGPPPY